MIDLKGQIKYGIVKFNILKFICNRITKMERFCFAKNFLKDVKSYRNIRTEKCNENISFRIEKCS